MSVEEIEAAALKLDAKSRAELAGRLLHSLDELPDEELEKLWIAEAEHRDAEMERDPAFGRSLAEVLREARAAIG